jgi:hypothetical protein
MKWTIRIEEEGKGGTEESAARQTRPQTKRAIKAKRAHADARDRDFFGDNSGGGCGVNAGLTFAVAFFDVGCRSEKRGETGETGESSDTASNGPKETKTEKQTNACAFIPAPHLCQAFETGGREWNATTEEVERY